MLYGLIKAKTRQKVVSRGADDVIRVVVEFRTSYSRFIDVAGRGENRNDVGRGKKFWTAQNFSPLIIRVPAVIKTWGDAIRCESLGVCHGHSTVIGRVLCVGITGNNVCLAAYPWKMDFCRVLDVVSSA